MVKLTDVGQKGYISESFGVKKERGADLQSQIVDFAIESTLADKQKSFEIVDFAASLAKNEEEQAYCFFIAGGILSKMNSPRVFAAMVQEARKKEIPDL